MQVRGLYLLGTHLLFHHHWRGWGEWSGEMRPLQPPATRGQRPCAIGWSSGNGKNTPLPIQLGRHQLWTRSASRSS